MFLSFISKAEQYFTPWKASTSRHPIDHLTPSTLADPPYGEFRSISYRRRKLTFSRYGAQEIGFPFFGE